VFPGVVTISAVSKSAQVNDADTSGNDADRCNVSTHPAEAFVTGPPPSAVKTAKAFVRYVGTASMGGN